MMQDDVLQPAPDLAHLLSQVADAIVSTDLNFVIRSWNAGAESLYGWTAEEAIGRSAEALLRPDFGAASPVDVLLALREQGFWSGEIVQCRKDGTVVEVLASTSCLTNAAGELTGLVSVNRDISARKQMERQAARRARGLAALLQVSEQLAGKLDLPELLDTVVRAVVTAVPAAEAAMLLLHDAAVDRLRVAAHTGYTEPGMAQLMVDPDASLLRAIFREGQARLIGDAQQDPAFERLGYPELDRLRSAVGVPLQVNGSRLGGLFADNFSRPNAFGEDDLRLLQSLAAQGAASIERARLHQQMQAAAATMEQEVAQRTAELAHANRQLQVEIVERRAAEAKLRYQANLLNQVSDAIISTDLNWRVVSWNKAAERIYGWSEAEARQMDPGMLQTDFLSETRTSIVQQIFAHGIWRGEVVQSTKDGRRIVVRSAVSLLRDQIGRPIGAVSINSDVTAQRRMAESERQQRLLTAALRDSAAALNSTLDLDEVLDRILDNVKRVVPHDVGNIMLVDAGEACIVRHHGYEVYDQAREVTQLRFSLANVPYFREMARTGRAVYIHDTLADARWQPVSGYEWLRTYVGAPIQWQDQTLGFLNLNSHTPGDFSLQDAERLATFADYAAIAIRNAQLYAQAQELASLRERENLARDLHDAVSQTLWSIALMADVLPDLWLQDRAKGESRLRRIAQLARSALTEMRLLLLELRPASLLEVNLPELLGQLLSSAAGRLAAEKQLLIDDPCDLPADVQRSLFRIAQEALNNAVRHSAATRIALQLSCTATEVVLRITDNGQGFELTAVPPGRLGLQIMQERAADIGARMVIHSRLEEGTTIQINCARKT
ncbi:MAG: PAS domain S-box protein [Anaerolineales bacterium]|nr:PAS domain S-box protein [Anaerolineales bacterium]